MIILSIVAVCVGIASVAGVVVMSRLGHTVTGFMTDSNFEPLLGFWRPYLPNINQWELCNLISKFRFKIVIILLLAPPAIVLAWLSLYIPGNWENPVTDLVKRLSQRYLTEPFQDWRQEVRYRQQIFRGQYDCLRRLGSICEDNLPGQTGTYALLNCGHVASWSTLEIYPIATRVVATASYRRLYGKPCGQCQTVTRTVTIVTRARLLYITRMARELETDRCVLTGEVLTRTSEIGLLPCGHYGGYSALREWFHAQGKCPFCRLTRHHLYFCQPDDALTRPTPFDPLIIGDTLRYLVYPRLSSRQLTLLRQISAKILAPERTPPRRFHIFSRVNDAEGFSD